MTDPKLTHAAVHYGQGMPRSHCSICKHYLTKRGGAVGCTLVRSPIKPDGWCDRFERKPQ